MIDKLKYDEILQLSKDIKEQISIIDNLVKQREMEELNDFISSVERYSKFLDSTVQMNKDADAALKNLAKQNGKEL